MYKSSCSCTSASSTVIGLTVRGASSPSGFPRSLRPWSLYLWSASVPRSTRSVTGRGIGRTQRQLEGVQVTARAILRFMQALPLPAIAPPRVIGLDEWAWKRGQRYGALVVDLERKKPIALLPDRSKPTVVQWLRRYPTINIVARDRSKEFAAAITEALPHAQHVADRWHLAKNLTEHLDKVVFRRWKHLTKAGGETEMPPELIPISTPARRPRQASGEARYQQMLALAQAGLPTRTIARRLGVGQRTIQHWLAQHMVHMRSSNRDAARSIGRRARLSQRWEAGERTARPLGGVERPKATRYPRRSVYRRLANGGNIHACVDRLLRLSQSLARPSKMSPLEGRRINAGPSREASPRGRGTAGLDHADRWHPGAGTSADSGFSDLIRHHNSEGPASGSNTCVHPMSGNSSPLLVVSSTTKRRFSRDSRFLTYRSGGRTHRPPPLIKRQAYGRAGLSYLQHRFLPAA